MLYIGSHVGFHGEDQLLGSLEEALKYQANTFMFYTGAPQNTKRVKIDEELTKKAFLKMKEEQIDSSKIIVHAPYIINLCNEENFTFSVSFLIEEMRRVQKLGLKYLVLHPGSHVGIGIEKGIENISAGLNKVFENLEKENEVQILLETMAGKGSEVGSTLEEIEVIIEKTNYPEKVGVCLDTCHLNDSGYDMSEFDSFLEKFDAIIGIEKIKCIHINDSKNEKASHKDRHENIGFGTIGFDALRKIIYHEKLKEVPKILETPYIDKKYAPYKEEIGMIQSQVFDPLLKEKIKTKDTCL